uniref:C2H2-type domain-containing protein n=1 Tax=Syphacia muris TaxID=451379 RepID=A0A0N5AFQ4_9BILA
MSEPSSAQQNVKQPQDVVLEMEEIITEDELLGDISAGVGGVGVEGRQDVANDDRRGEGTSEVKLEGSESCQKIQTRHSLQNITIKGDPDRTENDPGPSSQQITENESFSNKKLISSGSNKFVPVTSGGPIPRDAKVVVLMKSNAPGEKPTFVKLEPVTPPIVRTVPAEFSRAIAMARRKDRINNILPPEKPIRKRRIIPPITKKDKEQKKPVGKRGRPPKENEEVLSPRPKNKMVKTEPIEIPPEPESTGRPKRTHKTPKRYGDFYEPPVGYSDVHPNSTGLEEEAIEENGDENADEAQENSFAAEHVQNGEQSNKKTRITADVVNEDDYDPDEDEEDEETPEPVDVDGVDEGEAGAPQDVHLEGKEYEDFVSKEISKGKLQCERCHRFFANHNSMNAHRFKVHRIVVRASVKCPGCEHRATTIHTLNEHVAEAHGVKLQYIRRRFATTTDFQNYLDHLAATENMAFVRHRKSESKRQLYCNRSGAKRITKDPHIRNRPRKGTAKIGAMCPAHMFYTECDDGSIEVNGQLTHFGHTLDPRYVFPVTSAEKATSRLKPSSAKKAALGAMYGCVPVDLQVNKKPADEDTFINVDDTDSRRDEEMQEDDEYSRMEEEARLEEEFGPVHPKAEEIDIRMKNIDRLCSFLFDNVSEQLYRLDDTTMDVLLRSLRTTQNSISNLSSMMIQIKEGDPNVIQKFQRRGPRYGGWNSSRVSSGRSRKDGFQSAGRRQRQLYDTEDYDEDTVYYRHVPLRTTSDIENVYLVDDADEYYEADEY